LISKSQTLITGVYRTGSEYLTQLVNCHPQISATMYSVNAYRFIEGKFDPIHIPDNYLRALSEINQRIIVRYGKQIDILSIATKIKQHDNITYALIYDLVMTYLYLSKDTMHWVEKNQLVWREIPCFINSMPNGRAILVIRDPRSVLISFKKYTSAPPPAYLGAIFNCLDAMQYAKQYLESLPKDRFIILRYEDFAIAPQNTAELVWEFIGVDSNVSITESNTWLDAYGKPWHVNSSFHGNEDKSIFNVDDSVRRWGKKISQEELGMTEAICGDIMQYFKYDVITKKKDIDWLTIFKLFCDDKKMLSHFSRWLSSSKGIQEFPTDPLNSKNWEQSIIMRT